MLKLQTLSVIFVLIIVPITILLSYYIDNQIDTIALQNSYDTKLLNATYDAIVAFELNTINNTYSTNAESLRRDINASINTFNKSLANNFGISGSGSNYILPYIPAIVYTLYDGYYIYSPIENTTIDSNDIAITTYEHTLKPYVYYTARYTSGNDTDFIINYSLDNYIVVYGYIKGIYYSEAGYLIYGDKYKNYTFSGDAKTYYDNAVSFTKRFNDKVKNLNLNMTSNGGIPMTIRSNDIFIIDKNNDPDNKLSEFVEHKSTIIKSSIQSNLNSAIANYNAKSEGLGDFKMPILDEVEWDKMLSNVSIITFMQGLPVGFKTYNNYMIVTSTGNKQCVDAESLYFVATESDGKEGQYYHRINCPLLKNEIDAGKSIEGYKSIDFDGVYVVTENAATGEKEGHYDYHGHTALACYECIVSSRVGNFQYNEDSLITFRDLNSLNKQEPSNIETFRKYYYNALFKERNNLSKVSSYVNGTETSKF